LTAGDHRFGFSKNCPYEACIRTPFIVFAPWRYDARTDSNLVANIDLAPTFADLAGAEIPAEVDGRSIVPFFRRIAICQEMMPLYVTSRRSTHEDGVGEMCEVIEVRVFVQEQLTGLSKDTCKITELG